MPKFIDGPWEEKLTKETRDFLVMPIHKTARVALYKRRWEDGNYLFYGTCPEADVLGAVCLDEPCPTPSLPAGQSPK